MNSSNYSLELWLECYIWMRVQFKEDTEQTDAKKYTIDYRVQRKQGDILHYIVTCTVTLKPIHSVGPVFPQLSISSSILGQISKSGTVLKSTHSQLFKTVPDFEI